MNPMTKEGESLLREELKRLKNEERPRIIDAIASAREFGDLKENAEYHAAKDEQGKIEGRINQINYLFSNANIIDVTKLENKENVVFGSTVDLLDLESNKKKTFWGDAFKSIKEIHDSKYEKIFVDLNDDQYCIDLAKKKYERFKKNS